MVEIKFNMSSREFFNSQVSVGTLMKESESFNSMDEEEQALVLDWLRWYSTYLHDYLANHYAVREEQGKKNTYSAEAKKASVPSVAKEDPEKEKRIAEALAYNSMKAREFLDRMRKGA